MKTKWIIALCLLLLVSCTIMENSTETKESSIFQIAEVENCKVTTDTLNVKSGVGNSFKTITTLNKGDEKFWN